jgi:internalin A
MSEPQPNPAEFNSFADWCLHKDSLSKEARHTVELLLKKAGTSDINEANRILSNQSYLNLDRNQISDIAPLQSLTNFTDLSLGYNQISDITPLRSCAGLTHLWLENNQISDITPLRSCAGLTHLNLENNLISDLTPLQSCPSLMKVRVSFTPELKALRETSRQKWETLSNTTEPINRPKASAAVKAACEALGLEAPEINFCGSPFWALAQLQMQKESNDSDFILRLNKQILCACPFEFKDVEERVYLTQLGWEFSRFMRWEEHLSQKLNSDISKYRKFSKSIVSPAFALDALTLAEFWVAASGMVLKPEVQKAFECLKQILVECAWIFVLENVWIMCSRPTKLCLDSEYRLHAEGEPALEFSDGYKLYSYHGVTLPEKYGQIHPNQWEASWILEQENAELRRLLIQGIGYAKICSELQATDLDTWQEYTLLRIDADIDGFAPDEKEPIYLLKMTCPSTGFIHALRVPPDMQSAREAIRWVNWDVDYEEFSVQT